MASGSADKKIKLWDVIEGKCKSTFEHHPDKVQSLKWNPIEEKILASGGLEGNVFIKSADSSSSLISATVPSPVECLAWNPFESLQLSVSTEDGFLYTYDARNMNKALFEVKCHNEACTFSYSPGLQNMVATASKDKMVKIWDAATMNLIAERNAGVDELYCIEFYKDSPYVLATGGMAGELAIWDTEENEGVRNRWGGSI